MYESLILENLKFRPLAKFSDEEGRIVAVRLKRLRAAREWESVASDRYVRIFHAAYSKAGIQTMNSNASELLNSCLLL